MKCYKKTMRHPLLVFAICSLIVKFWPGVDLSMRNATT